MIYRVNIAIRGAVQGVGFRPFIYRMASELELKGFVKNNSSGVFIEAEGEKLILDNFIHQIGVKKPSLAKITSFEYSFFEPAGYDSFKILESQESEEISAFILPDIAVCDDCLKEMLDPTDRRYLYPFINCTNCGPRFSIIEALPYDRKNTTMKKFQMCERCREEYENPADRRYHAQPIACSDCGPNIELWDKNGTVIFINHDAIISTTEKIRAGEIIALKGIGGFQLICDANNDDSVRKLRDRKLRIDKPFALMFPDIHSIKKVCSVDNYEELLLLSPESPIVLLRRKQTSDIAPSVYAAPGNPYLGIMLPYSPLHHLLMREFNIPIIATSANISEEPMCIDEYEALKRLKDIADYFLVHNRPILRHVDDSVVRIVKGRVMVNRRARGYAPLPVELYDQFHETHDNAKPILALGGHLKNSIALKVGGNVFISQHIGDLESQEACNAFRRIVNDFQTLYKADSPLLIKDAHPDYYSSKYVDTINAECKSVQHHVAHIASCRAENHVKGRSLGIAWDGTGYGLDKTIWGGEFFIIDDSACTHVGTFRQFALPGGDQAVKEPRRAALGILYELYADSAFETAFVEANFREKEVELFKKMLGNKINCPLTSSVGRLFDAVASLLNINHVINFEGQAAMNLEFAVAPDETGCYDYKLSGTRFLTVDWAPIVERILYEIDAKVSAAAIAAKFHNTLVEIILASARHFAEEKVILSGGCFQNLYLLNKAIDKLDSNGYRAFWHQRVPTNDGGIALGQVAAANMFFTTNKNIET